MKKYQIIIVAILLLYALTGCVINTDKDSYYTAEEIKTNLEAEYGFKISYIEETDTRQGTRYWEFGLEEYPEMTFETYQRKDTKPIIYFGDIIILGIEQEIFDEGGGVDNIGDVLLENYVTEFMQSVEEEGITTDYSNYMLSIRVQEKENIDTAFEMADAFCRYLEEHADSKVFQDYSMQFTLLKDFRNPPVGEMQGDIWGDHTVRVFFRGRLTKEEAEEQKEEFITKWDEFEKTYRE